jgi:hypothetical protein
LRQDPNKRQKNKEKNPQVTKKMQKMDFTTKKKNNKKIKALEFV